MARLAAPGKRVVVTANNRVSFDRMVEPRINPFLRPLRRVINAFYVMAGKTTPKALPKSVWIPTMDRQIRLAGLRKLHGVTLGFGPFTFSLHPLCSEERGKRLYRSLQNWSESGIPVIRSGGSHYIVAAVKEPAR